MATRVARSSEVLACTEGVEDLQWRSSSASPASAFTCDAVDASLALLAFFDHETRIIMAESEEEDEAAVATVAALTGGATASVAVVVATAGLLGTSVRI